MANNKTDNLGRISPHSTEAEEAVLGCMLISDEAVSKAIHSLDAYSFYKKKHRIIFENIIELFNNKKNIDYISLIDILKNKKLLKDVGGSYYITGLSNEAPSFENIEYYAKIVKEKYVLRTIISVAKEISSEAFEGPRVDIRRGGSYLAPNIEFRRRKGPCPHQGGRFLHLLPPGSGLSSG